jgi:hypothetical protein
MKKQLLFEFNKSLFRKMSFRMAAFAVLTLLSVQSSFAQTWPILGNETAISSIASTHTTVAVVNESGNDIPYVAFCENAVPKVKKRLTDGTWVQVGANLGTNASYTRIYADAIGGVYVAYIDLSASSKLAIQKYNSTSGNWEPMGNLVANLYASTGNANGSGAVTQYVGTQRCSMAFDSSNTPYVAYSDAGMIPYVKKFDGSSWAVVGTGAVAGGFAAAESLVIDSSGIPWLAYCSLVAVNSNVGQLALCSYNSGTNAWVQVTVPAGATSTATTGARSTSLAISGTNTLCIAYFNTSNTNRATAVIYNKLIPAWTFATLASRDSPYLSVTNDSANNVYCSFQDYTAATNVFPLRVRYLATGLTTWTELKDPNVTRGVDEPVGWPAIAVANGSTVPFVVYTKANLAANIATPIVRKYNAPVGTAPAITNFSPSLATTAIVSTTFTISGINFTGATAVTYGGNSISPFTVTNDTSITWTKIPAAQTDLSISVTTPNGTASITGTAPSALSYASVPSTYYGAPLFPTVTATSTLIYSVSPALPAGFSINTGTGTISGTVAAVVASATYTITATNNYGTTATTVTFAAAPPTWNGTAWSNTTGPTASLDAIIDGTYSTTTNGAFIARKLTVNTGKSLTINSGTKVTVQNEVISNGSLVVENNANLIQVLGTTNTNTGNITVNRNSSPLLRLDYTLWSSPVAGQNLTAFSPLTSQDPSRFYTYDSAASAYSAILLPTLTTTNFAAGTGYLIRMPNTADAVTSTAYAGVFSGVLNNGNVPFTLSTAGGYTAVGNPYPSVIDANTFITANTANIESTLYFWRKTNGSGTAYAAYNPAGGTATYASTTSEVPNGKIQVGQGFFVQAKSAVTVPAFFTNAMREVSPTSTQFFKTRNVADKDRVWLNLTNTTGVFSQALVAYIADATQGIDIYDGKYINDSPVALTSNINNEEYSIQGRPAFDPSDVVALTFKTDVAGDYTIAIDHADGLFATGQDVYLVDSATGTETNLKAGAYTFAAAAGTANARFSLKYQKTLKVDASTFNENNVTVYKNKGTLYVNSGNVAIANIKVYDVQGRLLAELKYVKSTSATISNLKAASQVLVVKITSQENKVVTKKVVN